MSLALPLALGACASALPANPGMALASVPTQWSSASASTSATDITTWWTRFQDAQLSALVGQALQANTSVKSAQAALRQARALIKVQQAGLGPSLSASGSAQRSQSGSNDASNSFSAGFDASWEPDIFGGNRAAVDATEADAQASAASLADTQVSLAAEVATGYINLRGLQSRLAIARTNLDTQSDTVQITRWRAQAGLASSLDVAQAVGAMEQTSAQIPALQTSVSQALNALAVLTGQAPGQVNAALSQAKPVPPAPADLALAFPTDTLRQRPDVRAAEYNVRAALARVAMADAARYPSFQLSGSLGLSALTLGSLTNSASLVKSLLAGVSASIFDGGAARAQVRAQQAAMEKTLATYEGVVLTALQEVEDALVAIQGDAERLARLQAATTAAAQADELARQRYTSGLIDFATVLTTQRSLLSTQDSVATAQASLSTDHVRLYKSLGGGWTPDANSDTPNATAKR
ncbi:efflux transporter outer membrane subunit [Hydrogenophaga sp. PAMC20947]|uniref:efflux transporter outer membrane subunit n=1 Tax=Hydrogenophaga sp. PAMC20947 TaxID=2565558 RepID=UPI0032B59214